MRDGRHRLVIALAAALLAAGNSRGESYEGKEFPDFSARDAITGGDLSVKKFRGKVLLIDFWATWCPPCLGEIPNLKKAWARYHDKGLEIVSVSLDKDRTSFGSFVRRREMSWHHVMDGGGWTSPLVRKYRIDAIPRMIVVGPDGICIADDVRGTRLINAIERGLAKASAATPSGGTDRITPAGTEPPGSAVAAAERLDLAGARAAIARLSAPLTDAAERLERFLAGIDRLEQQMPVPPDPDRAVRGLELLYTDLADVRRDLFLLGLLDEETVPALPANPLTSASPRDPATWVIVRAALRPLREITSDMRARALETTAKLSKLQEEIAGLEGNSARLGRRASEVIDEAVSMSLRLDEAWMNQIESAEALVARCREPLDAARGRLEEARSRTAEVRELLGKDPQETSELTRLRDEFNRVIGDLEAASHAASGGAPELPENPFAGRRLRDRRLLSELEAQLKVSEEAAAALAAGLTEAAERYDGLGAALAALRAQLEKRLEAGESLADLRQQFADRLREVLALRDGAAPA